MARLNDLANGKLEAPKLRPEIIKIKAGHNYRDMSKPEVRAHIDWLKESIRAIGVQEPIDVTFVGGEVFLQAGECRLTAAQELRKEGWDGYIPAFAVTGDEAKVFAKGLLDNGGLPPSKMEFGKAVDKLLGWGWNLDQILPYVPSHLGLKKAQAVRYIKEAKELNDAPIAVKEQIKNGVDGVKVSEAKVLAEVRKNPLLAAENIKEAARTAKAAGRTEVKREKAEPVKASTTAKLLDLADAMCRVVLDPHLSLDEAENCAKAYKKARGL